MSLGRVLVEEFQAEVLKWLRERVDLVVVNPWVEPQRWELEVVRADAVISRKGKITRERPRSGCSSSTSRRAAPTCGWTWTLSRAISSSSTTTRPCTRAPGSWMAPYRTERIYRVLQAGRQTHTVFLHMTKRVWPAPVTRNAPHT